MQENTQKIAYIPEMKGKKVDIPEIENRFPSTLACFIL
jgi:hypothetical protein